LTILGNDFEPTIKLSNRKLKLSKIEHGEKESNKSKRKSKFSKQILKISIFDIFFLNSVKILMEAIIRR
jgi:hypothetical protein